MSAETLRIGTRGSRLALLQAGTVATRLTASRTDLEVRLTRIRTTGDKILDAPLSRIGDKGLFTKELEAALMDGGVDLVVHSLKDLPTRLPAGLALGAILEREDPRDVLVSSSGHRLADLPPRSRIGTSSLRRRSQLLAFRPDLVVEDLRGNVPTRIEKTERGEYGAVVLARAGIVRLGLESKITEALDPDVVMPAVGQGAIAIEIREGDARTIALTQALDDRPTRLAVLAERALLRRLEGGCQVPIGALGTLDGGRLVLRGLVADLEGRTVVRAREEGVIAPGEPGSIFAGEPGGIEREAEAIGERLALRLLEMGARPILEEIFEGARRIAVPAPGAEGGGE